MLTWNRLLHMFESILIPTDGSDEMETVVERATSMCPPGPTEIHSLYVIDHRALIPLGESEQETVAQTLKETGETALERVEEVVKVADPDFEFTSMISQGIPARQVLAYAKEYDIDAIVLGSHGQTMQKQAIGSTTERVVRGVNQLPDTTLVIIPIGPTLADDEPSVTEQAQDMFQ